MVWLLDVKNLILIKLKRMNEILNFFLNIRRSNKKIIIISFDLILCIFATWIALSIRLDKLVVISDEVIVASLVSFTIALPIFWFFSLYKVLIRHSDTSIISLILYPILIYSLIYFLIFSIFQLFFNPLRK